MQTLDYQITLKDDIILSSSSSSSEHSTLDYIPGNVLLGILASKIYAQLNDDEAFSIFHSGQISFNNAYINNALPIPLSWHSKKGEEYLDSEDKIVSTSLYDLSHRCADDLDNKQPKQLRSGYIDSCFKVHTPLSSYRLKTSIDPYTGKAKDGQLFGYQHLIKGQQFFGQIQINNEINNDLTEQIKSLLQGEVRLGRSKSSQYGRATLQWLNQTDKKIKKTASSKLTIWCLSDCCLTNSQTLQPSLQLQPEDLMVDGQNLQGKINVNQSFIRTRRYTPYNAYRGGHESEREVIMKGSVITLELNTPLEPKQIEQIEVNGIGIYKSQGLGKIAINHPWLTETFQSSQKERVEKSTVHNQQVVNQLEEPKNSLLYQWLCEQDVSDSKLQNFSDTMVKSLKYFYKIGRRFLAIANKKTHGLSDTQWGHLYELAKEHRTKEQLNQALFNDIDGLCKQTHNEEWSKPCNAKGQSFTTWLKDQITELENQQLNERDISLILTRTAKKAMRDNKQWLIGKELDSQEELKEKKL